METEHREALPAFGLGVLAAALVLGACLYRPAAPKAVEIELPVPIEGIRLYMSKAELLRARPQTQVCFVAYVKGPTEPPPIDPNQADDLLCERLPKNGFAVFDVKNSIVVRIDYTPDPYYTFPSPNKEKEAMQRLLLQCIKTWGSDYERTVSLNKNGDERRKSLAFEWKRGIVQLEFGLTPLVRRSFGFSIFDPSLEKRGPFPAYQGTEEEVNRLFEEAGLDDASLRRVDSH